MGLVDAVVDDADLDPLAGRGQRETGEATRPDRRSGRPCEGRVAARRVDPADAGQAGEPRQLTRGKHDGVPVLDELVAPAEGGRRDRDPQGAPEAALLVAQRPCGRRASDRRIGEWGGRERDDDLGGLPALMQEPVRPRAGRTAECQECDGEGEEGEWPAHAG